MKPRRKHDVPPVPSNSNNPWTIFSICVFLVVIVFIVFGQALRFPFVNYDDNIYVYKNPAVVSGVTLSGTAAAFSASGMDNWIPLTMLSHMLDCQAYGINAGGHHLTNILLHAANAVLLFLVLYQMTAAIWRCAFVAAVFAVHPLGVESVAWISERKDVLSGFFFMLTLWAYAGYVRDPKSWIRYVLVLVFAALGLMSKPMLVTLPFVLLLLDHWPLKRMPSRQLISEKIPLLVLSFAACIVTFITQQKFGAVNALPTTLFLRIENIFFSYARYLGKIFWPDNLAVLYPFPGHWPVWPVLFSATLVLGLCVGAVVLREKFPYGLTGWFWFAGMLIPVIGVVQIGFQAMADRYMYLPQIGLYVLFTWLVAELFARLPQRPVILGSLSAVVITALIYRAHAQVASWKDSEPLWSRALACTPVNVWSDCNAAYSLALDNLGDALLHKGQVDDAIIQFQQAIEVDPNYAVAHNNLGNALVQKGRLDEAVFQFQEALKLAPKADFYGNLGGALLLSGKVDQAILQYQQASKLAPDDALVHYNLADALIQKGQVDDAIAQYRETLKLDPGYALAHFNLGTALFLKGEVDDAIGQYLAALKIQPDNAQFQNTFAHAIWILATASDANPTNTAALAQQVNELAGGNNPSLLRVLAAAQARCGHFSEAIKSAQRASELAGLQQNAALARSLQQEIALYQAGTAQTNVAGW